MDKKYVKNQSKTGSCETNDMENRWAQKTQETPSETGKNKDKNKKISSSHEWRAQKEGAEKDSPSRFHPSRGASWAGQKSQKTKNVKVQRKSNTNELVARGKGSNGKGKGSTKLHVPVTKLQKITPITSSSIRNLRERLQKIVNALSLIEEKCIGEKPQQKRKNREGEGPHHRIKVSKKRATPPASPSSSSLSSFHSSVGGDHGRENDTRGGAEGGGGGNDEYRASSPPLRNVVDGIDEFLNSHQQPKNYYYDIMMGTGGGGNVDADENVYTGGGCASQSVQKALPELSDLYSDFDSLSYTSESQVSGSGLKK